MTLVYGSVCSGIEAATVAWRPLGWRAAFFAEIEPFPSAVLAHHYPAVPNYGDLTRFREWPDATLDVLVGGTPCQSFSVAGLRKGLDDPRGNLALVYLALVDRYRPRWVVWENVPGVLSSASGEPACTPPNRVGVGHGERVVDESEYDEGGDFTCFLAALGELGYGWAYRVLDARYFGVPQRRRRVFVVGHLGDWRRAAAVLFERASLSGHPAPRQAAQEGTAPTLAARTHGGGGLGTDAECDGALIPHVARCVTAREGARQDWETETMIAHALRADGFDASEDGTGRGTPLVPTWAIQERAVAENPESGPQGKGFQSDIAYTLEARHHAQAVAFNWQSGGDMRHNPSASGTDALTANQTPAIAFDWDNSAGAPNSTTDYQTPSTRREPAIMQQMAVRRLTPRECERLQGFPDDYTLIPYRGKLAADGPRYKALGNSMAVPCMRWIGERIAMAESATQEAAA